MQNIKFNNFEQFTTTTFRRMLEMALFFEDKGSDIFYFDKLKTYSNVVVTCPRGLIAKLIEFNIIKKLHLNRDIRRSNNVRYYRFNKEIIFKLKEFLNEDLFAFVMHHRASVGISGAHATGEHLKMSDLVIHSVLNYPRAEFFTSSGMLSSFSKDFGKSDLLNKQNLQKNQSYLTNFRKFHEDWIEAYFVDDQANYYGYKFTEKFKTIIKNVVEIDRILGEAKAMNGFKDEQKVS